MKCSKHVSLNKKKKHNSKEINKNKRLIIKIQNGPQRRTKKWGILKYFSAEIFFEKTKKYFGLEDQ